jgi:hypothetical protein
LPKKTAGQILSGHGATSITTKDLKSEARFMRIVNAYFTFVAKNFYLEALVKGMLPFTSQGMTC